MVEEPSTIGDSRMASKKKRGRPKGSKNKTHRKVSKTTIVKKTHRKKVHHKRITTSALAVPKASLAVPKASLSNELSLLQKIDKKVTRIDHTVNAGHFLAKKAKKHARQHNISQAFEEAERSG